MSEEIRLRWFLSIHLFVHVCNNVRRGSSHRAHAPRTKGFAFDPRWRQIFFKFFFNKNIVHFISHYLKTRLLSFIFLFKIKWFLSGNIAHASTHLNHFIVTVHVWILRRHLYTWFSIIIIINQHNFYMQIRSILKYILKFNNF